jgi:hypothetical protein
MDPQRGKCLILWGSRWTASPLTSKTAQEPAGTGVKSSVNSWRPRRTTQEQCRTPRSSVSSSRHASTNHRPPGVWVAPASSTPKKDGRLRARRLSAGSQREESTEVDLNVWVVLGDMGSSRLACQQRHGRHRERQRIRKAPMPPCLGRGNVQQWGHSPNRDCLSSGNDTQAGHERSPPHGGEARLRAYPIPPRKFLPNIRSGLGMVPRWCHDAPARTSLPSAGKCFRSPVRPPYGPLRHQPWPHLASRHHTPIQH